MPGTSPTAHEAVIGLIDLFLMMGMVMPMAGAHMLAMSIGLMAPKMMLVIDLIFGAVLGWTYNKLQSSLIGVVAARA